MSTDFRALCAELLDELVFRPVLLDRDLIDRARTALAEPVAEPVAEPPAVTERPSDEELGLIYHDCCGGCEFMDQGGFEDAARAVLARWGRPAPPAPPADYIDPEHSGTNREMLEVFYSATLREGGTADEIALRGINAVLARWGQPPAPPAEGEVAELVEFLRGVKSLHCQRAADLLERVPELTQQLETERMRLAVCGVVAMSDTPESAAKARDCLPDYWSASADDIARQIDELMRLRARMERHAAPVPLPAPQGGEVEP